MNYNKNMDLEHNPILDSNLILTTIRTQDVNKLCNVKVVECGDYVQVYFYKNPKKITILDYDDDLKLNKKNIEYTFENKEKKEKIINLANNIDEKNIIRSKLECQRLAKSNISSWKTFITLTFADTYKFDITDILSCNKKFRYFVDKVQRIKKDFKYICIPEFQKKRGKKYGIEAVHYHLLTNIDINDKLLIFSQEDNLKFKHIKYWNDGFNKVDSLKGDTKKIIGYISKYMTKDIDNRLFNRHRYFFSRNLCKPKVNFLNLDNYKENIFYKKRIQDKELIYQNEYINPYDNNQVTFLEFVKK